MEITPALVTWEKFHMVKRRSDGEQQLNRNEGWLVGTLLPLKSSFVSDVLYRSASANSVTPLSPTCSCVSCERQSASARPECSSQSSKLQDLIAAEINCLDSVVVVQRGSKRGGASISNVPEVLQRLSTHRSEHPSSFDTHTRPIGRAGNTGQVRTLDTCDFRG